MTWKRITFREGKTHAVHADFEERLLVDLRDRLGLVPATLVDLRVPGYDRAEWAPIKEIIEWRLDLGGGCYVDEPMADLGKLDGLALDAPCRQVAILLENIPTKLTGPVRRFADGTPYHKLHHWHFCLVLTPEQLTRLQALLAAVASASAQRAAAFDRMVEERLRRRS